MPKVVGIKQFSFVLEADGIDQFEVQEITTPDLTIEEVEHGEGNKKVRTPGMVSIGDLTLSRLKKSTTADFRVVEWFEQVQNARTGTGGTPDLYLRNVVLRQQDNAGNTVETWEFKEAWVKQISGTTHSATASDNVIQEVVLVVNDYSYS
jgi:phage tail-like protein